MEGNFGVSSPTSKSPRMEIQQPLNTSFKATSLPQWFHFLFFFPWSYSCLDGPDVLSSQHLPFVSWVWTHKGSNKYRRFKTSKCPLSNLDLLRTLLGLMPCECGVMSSGPWGLAAVALPSSPCNNTSASCPTGLLLVCLFYRTVGLGRQLIHSLSLSQLITMCKKCISSFSNWVLLD